MYGLKTCEWSRIRLKESYAKIVKTNVMPDRGKEFQVLRKTTRRAVAEVI